MKDYYDNDLEEMIATNQKMLLYVPHSFSFEKCSEIGRLFI
jgi:hypothetical protein